jgi:phospholipid/cholesterol/gamma-HCH transport system ATP-binding protein
VANGYLVLENVRLQFGEEVLLDQVNIEIAKGEVMVLVGPSGHGKSSVLKMLGGILPPTSGRVLVGGEDLYALPSPEKREWMLKMGMLFQKNALFDSLSVAENIAFPLREVTSCGADEISKRVNFFLEAVGLSASAPLFPDEISGGMQKRLGIARAMALYPEIIFYDDPTAGLDPITSRKIIDLILTLKKERSGTVVAIANEMARAYQMADRIALVVDGEIIVTGDKRATLAHPDPRVHQFVRGEIEGPLTEMHDSI